ncbi:hypothetical protein F4805DRAFT_459374 [Annulohypoxylon moriforme]|nr:hypothetical protein F4805DRAFT_459374 [Annulohypoxylon moriforme]
MFHFTSFTGPNSGSAMADQMEAINLSNQASAAMTQGRFGESITLHQQALELKLKSNPELCVRTGITYNGLGEALLRAGRLEEADDALSKALAIREKEGPDQDISATRDNMGQLREAQGRFADAKEVRLRGAGKKMIMCGYYDCPTHATLGLNKLSACSACESVFYCSKSCQRRDWVKRHKPLCEAYQAVLQATKVPDTKSTEQADSQSPDKQSK